MSGIQRLAIGLLSLGALLGGAQAVSADMAADTAAVRAVNQSWFKAYNAGNAGAVAALYADDAVLCPPGAPAARGGAAIRAELVKEIADTAAGGVSLKQGTTIEIGISGDLAWESNSFTVVDKSGATVDTGKYLTVYGRKNGKWQIVRDIWNSDVPPVPAVPK